MQIRNLLFFFNDTATTDIYTLSLHDALPICPRRPPQRRSSPIPHSPGQPGTTVDIDLRIGEMPKCGTEEMGIIEWGLQIRQWIFKLGLTVSRSFPDRYFRICNLN